MRALLNISKTIGLSSAREREKSERTYTCAYIHSRNIKSTLRWREKLLTRPEYKSREYGGLCQIQICQTMYIHMIAHTYDCAYACVRT